MVTLHYRSRELLVGHSPYGPEVDIWSAGCVVAEMLIGSVLFCASSEIEMLREIDRRLLSNGTTRSLDETRFPQLDGYALHLVNATLNFPNLVPTAGSLVASHPFFSE